jgi:DHA1 family multidrug resistance protein-like MFS transporter
VIWLVRESAGGARTAGLGSILENYRTVFGTPQFRLLFLTLLGSQFALMSLTPVMALYVESLGAHGALLATTTGAIFAVSGVASAIAAPRWGRESDRKGYRRSLGRALLGTSLFAAPQGIVAAPWQLFFTRIPYGAFIGGIVPSAQAMIGIRAPDERRAGIMGVTSTALMLGNLTGPLVGGAVAGQFGLRSVFFLSTAVLVLLLVAVYPRVREPEPEAPGGPGARPAAGAAPVG